PRLSALRELMQKYGVNAYIVPSTDPHQSEYVPAFWERRKFLSGFTGSAGDVVVTGQRAALFTDSRYFIQAALELDGSTIELMKVGQPGTPSPQAWLIANLSPGDVVGIDPRLHTATGALALEQELEAAGISLVSIDDNLVDEIWEEQPEPPLDPLVIWPVPFAGEERSAKLRRVYDAMAAHGVDTHVVSALDAIAWLLNIRCSDVEFNPVVIAYVLLSNEQCTLFVDPRKVTEQVAAELGPDVKLASYDAFPEALANLEAEHVLLDQGSASRWIVDMLGEETHFALGHSPITLMKAVKNPVELSGFAQAHLRDGVAMVRFIHWLHTEVPRGQVTELSAAAALEGFRSELEYFRGLSFETISAHGPHGAIVHYSATPESNVPLTPQGFYLVDSGGQYLDGTTDITRTLALGPATAEMKRLYTLVLRGHLDLAMALFPVGTAGKQLDTIARKPLWDAGLNYSHGTGHGIGAYLNVHEGPHAISFYRCVGVPLEPGMVTSNEPGYYLEGAFGIRIENVLSVVESDVPGFLTFNDFTLCPYERGCIDAALLEQRHLAHIDAYHARCRELLAPHLSEDERQWLTEATLPVS
ncbi:aminopeptidase P family protein, partial [Myxococcota bacterium]|nr:aminopeptidase P family protein [Myxococcota bacterium]